MRVDPHSYADLDQGRCHHVELDWKVDFEQKVLDGQARLEFDRAIAGPLDLDTRDLRIREVRGPGGPLRFSLVESDDILGTCLRIERPEPIDWVEIVYTTGDASGLMWLAPEQTSGSLPFVLSQCQPLHARSLAPLQDTPEARITYTARLALPVGVQAVMSAAPAEQKADGRWLFDMPQPIPPYLLAIAAGELASRDLGPRTRVHAEPAVLEDAAWEFAQVESMLESAETLFGAYAWERFDFVVLPPSFPMGGMENPRMTFLTPTLLAGDRSLVAVLAHELAHSWTGNLVTNINNEHFWLNEGWTVYAERRIVEELYGREAAVQEAALERIQLDATIERRRAAGASTALTYDQKGIDPDLDFSLVPYEKGFLLLTALERAVGRDTFDVFVRSYIDTFRFTGIDTDTFVRFVRDTLGEPVDLEPWLYEDGLPDGAPTFTSERLSQIADRAARFHTGVRPERDWTAREKLFYLARLPRLTEGDCNDLDRALGLRDTRNAEIRSAWLTLAATAGMASEEPAFEQFFATIGRTKLLRPVLRGLVSSGMSDLATKLVDDNAARLHGSTVGVLRRVLEASA